MSTKRQKTAVKKMVENGGNASRAMRDSGYSPATAKNPSKLTKSKGYLEMLDELGLTEELIITSLVEDIKTKMGKRKAELELAAKLRGMMKRSDIGEVKEAEKPILGGLSVALVKFEGDDGLEYDSYQEMAEAN